MSNKLWKYKIISLLVIMIIRLMEKIGIWQTTIEL